MIVNQSPEAWPETSASAESSALAGRMVMWGSESICMAVRDRQLKVTYRLVGL